MSRLSVSSSSVAPWHLLCAAALLSLSSVANAGSTKLGDAVAVLIPGVALGATVFAENKWDGTVEFTESFATSTLVTEALKHTVNRTRPDGGSHSFPSGHASAAFMGAAFIQKRYGWKRSIPAYLGAVYVGYERVHDDKHHTSDVLAGAAIGMLSSYYFTTRYLGFAVSPYAESDGAGVEIHARW